MKSRNNSTIYCRVNDSNELEFSITSSKWIAPQKYQEIKKRKKERTERRKKEKKNDHHIRYSISIWSFFCGNFSSHNIKSSLSLPFGHANRIPPKQSSH